jgi:hypothetical protein
MKTKEQIAKYNKEYFCHKTGKVRGILCPSCNLALGLFKDNVDVLSEAIIYLNKNEISNNNSIKEDSSDGQEIKDNPRWK